MSFKTATKVVYGDDEITVNGETFVEIEDSLEAIDKLVGLSEGDKDAAKEWITYNGLINAGYFVSKPTTPEPNLSKTFAEPESSFEPVPFYPPREQIWTQEKILNEREKLLRKQEKLFRDEVKIEQQRQQKLEEQIYYELLKARKKRIKFNPKLYNPDGTEWTIIDYAKFAVTLLFLGAFVLAIIKSL